MPNIGRVVLGQGEPKNVTIKSTNRTSISSPNFEPKVNVSINEIKGLDVSVRSEGDVLLYDSVSGEYISSSIAGARIELDQINGGRF